MYRERYFDEYEVGQRRETGGRTITEADIVLHAGQTGDFYPHHMDAEWCKTQFFGQRVAHGTLIFAMAAGMTAEDVNPVAFTYGYDRLRFVRPVHIGDTIRVTVEVAKKAEQPKRPEYGVVYEETIVRNQRDEVVLVFTHLYLVQCREPE